MIRRRAYFAILPCISPLGPLFVQRECLCYHFVFHTDNHIGMWSLPPTQKEQADGVYQNLVLSVMVERNCDLQTAIDVSTDMMRSRVEEYLSYKTQLPLFGDEVDGEIVKYVRGLEHYV